MLSSPPSYSTIRLLVRACQKHPARWLAPAVIITALSFAYAQFVVRPVRPAIPTLAAGQDQVETRGGESQDRTTMDTIAKWIRAVDLASTQLDASYARLANMESSAVADHDELAGLSAFPGENGDQQLANTERALRQAENELQSNREFLRLLETVRAEPGQLATIPSHRLESHPELRQIQDELAAAQAHTTLLLETRLPVHPTVQASLAIEETICQRLQRELGTVADGLRAAQRGLEERIATRTQESTQLQERLLQESRLEEHRLQERRQRLSLVGANHARQLANIQQWTDTLTRAKSELAAAQAKRAEIPTVTPSPRSKHPATSGHDVNDVHDVRAFIVATGLIGGWLVGMGILWLTSRTNAEVASLPAVTQLTVRSAEQPAVAPVWQPLSSAAADETTCSPRPSGHMTLRDALAHCAQHANNR
ncbi:MAG: GumC domain-containing protein [Pirellulaceae bacterium]